MSHAEPSETDKFSGTRPVSDAHAFDTGRLADFMRQHVDGFRGDLAVAQFNGGQSNPTFMLSAGGKRYVLRRKPPGVLLPSAHAVDREYRVITALGQTDVPVARTYALCEDPEVIGTAFYIMDCVPGRVLWDPRLPGMAPAERAAIFDDMNRVIAALHQVDPVAIGLADYGKPGGFLERQVGRWTKQYRMAETERIEEVERLIEWLPAHMPAEDPSMSGRITHGDYRLDNVMVHATEPRIVAVLDWELSTLGHPLVDFAYHCMTWRMPTEGMRGLAGVDFAALGIPTENAYLQRYLQRTGRPADAVSPAEWAYYLAFNLFRLMSITQGIVARVLSGTASNPRAAEAATRVRPLAEMAWAMAQQVER